MDHGVYARMMYIKIAICLKHCRVIPFPPYRISRMYTGRQKNNKPTKNICWSSCQPSLKEHHYHHLTEVQLENNINMVACAVGLSTHANGSCNGRVFTSVCLWVCFSAWYLKNRCSQDHQTWPIHVPRWVLEAHLLQHQKVIAQGHESIKHCRRGSLHSCECWLLLVCSAFSTQTVVIIPVHVGTNTWNNSCQSEEVFPAWILCVWRQTSDVAVCAAVSLLHNNSNNNKN